MLANLWLKRKIISEALVLAAVVALVALAAFGLGRLSALQAQQDKLVIHYPNEASTTPQTPIQ